MTSELPFPELSQICDIMADLGAVYTGTAMASAPPGALGDADGWTSFVSLRGSWNGEVIVSGSRAFAVQAASDLLGIAESDITDDEARDSLGELANIISGNLKPLLSADGDHCVMSPPCVLQGQQAMRGLKERQRIWFRWRSQSFCVRMVDSAATYAVGHKVYS